MIELRWLEVHCKPIPDYAVKNHAGNWQVKQMRHVAHKYMNGEDCGLIWSDWTDIPVEIEK